MQTKSRSIYSCARVAAGITQEAAAEALNLSVRALADSETEQRRPPAPTVAQMAALYRAPGLRLQHARETDELGIIPRSAEPCSLEQAALRLDNRLRRLCRTDRAGRLSEIAEDGVIDETEMTDYQQIVDELRELQAAILALEVFRGTKKDRLDGGTSKRSILSKTENHSNNSISVSEPNCNSNFARGCTQ